MQVHSVNVSLPKTVVHDGKSITTGIFKEPVAGRATVRRRNIDGDDQADRRVHGVGFDMAIYAYPFEHYDHWRGELGRGPFPFGQFGENLTVSGLLEDEVRVGDVFAVGSTRLQVTQPRIPCYKLTLRMGESADFPARFQKSGRTGFYLRVLQEGEIGAGDPIQVVERAENSVTIGEFLRTYLHASHDPASLKRVLASPGLSDPWRKSFDKMLAKAEPVATPEGWEGVRAFLVDRKEKESDTITSFYLAPEDGAPLPGYRPGQFLPLRLAVPGHDEPVLRTYTLSESPARSRRRNTYRITVKRESAPAGQPDAPPGVSSSYLHDLVEPGSRLLAKAPRGKFFLDPTNDAPVVLASAGVGLTPMVSMLNAIVDAGVVRPVWFVHGARNGREHALAEHVRRLADEHEHIHVHIAYSRPDPEDERGRDFDSEGRVDAELLERIVPPAAYDYFLCGPSAFMEALHARLVASGVPAGRIRYEFFGKATAFSGSEDAAAATPAPTTPSTVGFARSATAATWDGTHDDLLGFAEAQGLSPDFSCRSGVCHTCTCKLLEGQVEYITEPADRPDPGHVLICCARPSGDIVLDL